MAYFGHICFPLGQIMITPWAKNTVFSLFFAHEGVNFGIPWVKF
jgi:hypothetical protein